MPFIDLRKFPLSEFPYHTHNSLSVTLFIHPISRTISSITFNPIPLIPLESTLLLYNQDTHVIFHIDPPPSLPNISGSTHCSKWISQVSLWVFITSLRMIFSSSIHFPAHWIIYIVVIAEHDFTVLAWLSFMLDRSSIWYLIKSRMRGPAGRSSLTYCGTAILISIVAVQDCILTRKGVFPLLYILTSMICCVTGLRHSNMLKMVTQGGFDLHFPDNQWCATFL